MKRLGMYSGGIYEESEAKGMKECGLCITDEQANNKDYIQEQKDKNFLKCSKCLGCPMAALLR